MKREFIEGMKTLGSIAAILLQAALESMAKAQEEKWIPSEDLRNWK